MSESVATIGVTITNPEGMHARPASMFVQLAGRFQSSVEIVKGGERVDGKSILAILTLAAEAGSELLIEARGADADEAVRALSGLVEGGFAEDRQVN